MSENNFTWIPFYEELANKLLNYKNNRKELIEKMKNIFTNAGYTLPKMEKDSLPTDIDPFTFFAHFNKGNTNQRPQLIQEIAKELDIKANIPTDFNGIPSAYSRRANFFIFKQDGRGEHDIDILWELFESAIKFADNSNEGDRQTFCTNYNNVIELDLIKYNITMGLYWIRPYYYLNLDGRNRWFLQDVKNMPEDFVNMLHDINKDVPTASNYLQIIDKVKTILATNNYPYKNFPELSYQAWKISEEVNQRKKEVNNLEPIATKHYWLFSPGKNAENWETFYKQGIMAIGWSELNDLRNYVDKEQIRNKMYETYGTETSHKNDILAVWQFAKEIKQGDIIFVKKGMSKIIGRGEVISDYEFDSDNKYNFKHIRKVKWTHKAEMSSPQSLNLKTLTDITNLKELTRELDSLFDEDSEEETNDEIKQFKPYSDREFLDDVFMSRKDYENLYRLLEKKQNIILEGAPGVGKTYAATKLAYSFLEEVNTNRVTITQFHQSYSYEDFIMGFRPNTNGNGFTIKEGIFYKFCKKAREDSSNDYFFIIDEINRGNLSKILGELFMLLESDKRGQKLKLMYRDDQFDIPKNVYIIGTMNTADRSIAMVDYALRRRFAFFSMKPGFETDGFIEKQKNLNDDKFNELVDCVKRLNQFISEDESLGEGFCIGHSYFCNCFYGEKYNLSDIVEYELIPLLKEYWFDNPKNIKTWSDALRKAIQ